MADRTVQVQNNYTLNPSPVGGDQNLPKIYPQNTITWSTPISCTVCDFNPSNAVTPSRIDIDANGSGYVTAVNPGTIRYKCKPYSDGGGRNLGSPQDGSDGIIIIDPPVMGGSGKKSSSKPKSGSAGKKTSRPKAKPKKKTKPKAKPARKSKGKKKPAAKRKAAKKGYRRR